MTRPLDEAREALAGWDAPRCGKPAGAHEGIPRTCSREPSHEGVCLDSRTPPDPSHLRSALLAHDALAAENAALREVVECFRAPAADMRAAGCLARQGEHHSVLVPYGAWRGLCAALARLETKP